MAVPDSIAERLIQACREWIKAAAGGLTDTQVIPSNDKGVRPALPYLTVRLTASDVAVGQDEDFDGLADTVDVGGSAPAGTDYALVVNDEPIAYTKAGGEDDSDVAAALAALIDALEDAAGSSDGATIQISAVTGLLVVSTSDPNLTLTEGVTPMRSVGAQRSAVLSVQGFGLGAAAWLESLPLSLRRASIMEQVDAAGLSIQPQGGMTDLAQLLDTGIEGRFLREFAIQYALRSDPEAGLALENVEASLTLERYDSDPDPLTVDLSIPVS